MFDYNIFTALLLNHQSNVTEHRKKKRQRDTKKKSLFCMYIEEEHINRVERNNIMRKDIFGVQL